MSLNWLLILVIIILIRNLRMGYRRGLLNMLYRVASSVLSFLLAIALILAFGEDLVRTPLFCAVSFAVIFALIRLALGLVGALLDRISELPVLRILNRITGAAAGILYGLFKIWILFIILELLGGTAFGANAASCITGNTFLHIIAENNILRRTLAAFLI